MPTDPDCLFCNVATGKIPAEVVAEGDGVLAFRDIDPKAPTHVLVIPTEHVASLAALATGTPEGAAMLAELVSLANRVAAEAGLDAEGAGYRVVTNVGPEAGQSVAHLHLHVLGGRPMTWPPG
jgi:histidine triad (HIT) family protein